MTLKEYIEKTGIKPILPALTYDQFQELTTILDLPCQVEVVTLFWKGEYHPINIVCPFPSSICLFHPAFVSPDPKHAPRIVLDAVALLNFVKSKFCRHMSIFSYFFLREVIEAHRRADGTLVIQASLLANAQDVTLQPVAESDLPMQDDVGLL